MEFRTKKPKFKVWKQNNEIIIDDMDAELSVQECEQISWLLDSIKTSDWFNEWLEKYDIYIVFEFIYIDNELKHTDFYYSKEIKKHDDL